MEFTVYYRRLAREEYDTLTAPRDGRSLAAALEAGFAGSVMDGLTVVKKVWDGRANLAEYKADGPTSRLRVTAIRNRIPMTAENWKPAFVAVLAKAK